MLSAYCSVLTAHPLSRLVWGSGRWRIVLIVGRAGRGEAIEGHLAASGDLMAPLTELQLFILSELIHAAFWYMLLLSTLCNKENKGAYISFVISWFSVAYLYFSNTFENIIILAVYQLFDGLNHGHCSFTFWPKWVTNYEAQAILS